MNHRGFTLVEVMVALLVVVLAVSSLLVQMMKNVDGTAYLRDKAIASWVAMNQLELELLANRHSNTVLTDEKSGVSEMAGREWYWQIKPLKTANDQARQLQVSVFADKNDDSPVTSVMGLVDSYHRR